MILLLENVYNKSIKILFMSFVNFLGAVSPSSFNSFLACHLLINIENSKTLIRTDSTSVLICLTKLFDSQIVVQKFFGKVNFETKKCMKNYTACK